MSPVIDTFCSYLGAALGQEVRLRLVEDAARIPMYLRDQYRFYSFTLLGHELIAMVQKAGDALSPGTVKKHHEAAAILWGCAIVFVTAEMTSFNRLRLVRHRVPFVVPGNQMYLPDLGIDFREYFRRARARKRAFSPSTQALLLFAINNRAHGPFTPTRLARDTGYSVMTVSRVFDELESAGIVETLGDGRERVLPEIDRPADLWTAAGPFLRSPVMKTVPCIIDKAVDSSKVPVAGLSALSWYSMLSPPEHAVKAMGMREWKAFRKQKGVMEIEALDDGALEIQVWRYPPELLCDGKCVDPLSLYLSLRDSDDERIAISLDEMMEKHQW